MEKTVTYLISHRGNISGPNPQKENNPAYIKEALAKGYDVEVDVWYVDDKFWLGHDKPTYETDYGFLLSSPKLWIHAKNVDALYLLHEIAHVFFIDSDQAVLTSKNVLWNYTGIPLTPHSIAVLPEQTEYTLDELQTCLGICSDNIENYRKYFE